MIHARQSARCGLTAQGPGPRPLRGWTGRVLIVALSLVAGSSGCADGGTQPEALRYGQVGSIRVMLDAPLRPEAQRTGRLKQTLQWGSGGSWTIQEAISYQGVTGDVNFRRSPGDPSQYAADYAGLITRLNEVDGLKIYNFPDLSPDAVPECGATRTRITFTLRDDPRDEETTWIRCATGSLATLTPANAGPDPAASRIAQAALLARNFTLGQDFSSVYAGSVPFATLDRGVDLVSGERVPTAITDSASFQSFWGQAGGGRPLPAVDFSSEMVILGVAGEREEAGDSVEVRRILQVDQGTVIEIWERIPGDFCSPAARVHVPYHVVLAPLTPLPLRFADIRVERVPCGG